MEQPPKGKAAKKPTKRQKKRVENLVSLAETLERNEIEQQRTEALITARALALAGLPKRKTANRDMSRTLRLGEDMWLRVIYSTSGKEVLPFGEDRFVLAAIQTLAIEQNSPLVFLDDVASLLRMFDLSADGRTMQRLWERFKRLTELTIRLRFARTEQGLDDAPLGESMFVIENFVLPTAEEALSDKIVQLRLPHPVFIPEHARYAVVLSGKFWQHIQDVEQRLILPLELMRAFVDRPTGWDYAAFLVYRCTRAKRTSIVPHDVLMGLFKDNPKERDSQTIERLQKYHDEVMQAMDGYLNATLEQDGHFPTTKKGGRPKERWLLRVGPSRQVIWSGKQIELFPPPES